MDIQLLDHAVPDVLTPMEAAKILHMGRSTIYVYIDSGYVRVHPNGAPIGAAGRLRDIKIKSLEKFEKSNKSSDFMARPKGLEPPTFRTGI